MLNINTISPLLPLGDESAAELRRNAVAAGLSDVKVAECGQSVDDISALLATIKGEERVEMKLYRTVLQEQVC